jgi:hypothetical protein
MEAPGATHVADDDSEAEPADEDAGTHDGDKI